MPKPKRKSQKENQIAGPSNLQRLSQLIDDANATVSIEEIDDGQVALREGDNEAMYIYLDLSELPVGTQLANTTVELTGLDTDQPNIKLQDGASLKGRYVDSVGSQLFFQVVHPPQPGVPINDDTSLNFVGLSEKIIRFRKHGEDFTQTRVVPSHQQD